MCLGTALAPSSSLAGAGDKQCLQWLSASPRRFYSQSIKQRNTRKSPCSALSHLGLAQAIPVPVSPLPYPEGRAGNAMRQHFAFSTCLCTSPMLCPGRGSSR